MSRLCKPRAHAASGLTLVELLMASAVMSIIVAVTGTLALAVRQGWEASQGHAEVCQQSRVVLDRIRRQVQGAYASATHPGFGVVSTTVGSYSFPDTLVIWAPTGGVPSSATGPPLVRECIFVCPDPANPSQLVEITASNDSRSLPLDSQLNTSTYRTLVDGVKTASTSRKVVLTTLLRTAVPVGSTNGSRGAVRFVQVLAPTASEWSSYQAGTLSWANLNFPQGVKGQTVGLRQSRLKIELQMVSPLLTSATAGAAENIIAVPGSAALYYTVAR